MVKKKVVSERPRTHRTTRTVRHISRPSASASKTKSRAARRSSSLTLSNSAHLAAGNKPAARPVSSRTIKRRATQTAKARRFSWSEITLLSITGVCTLIMLITLIVTATFDPERDAKKAISRLADDYYTHYFYPISLGKNLSSPESVLADYSEAGLPTVRLRQLLYYNNGINLSSLSKISNSYYNCDPNNTLVHYFPIAPYGPRDYTVEFSYACEDLRS